MATAPAKVWAGPIPSDGRLPLSFRELVERAPLQLNNDGTRKQASKQARAYSTMPSIRSQRRVYRGLPWRARR